MPDDRHAVMREFNKSLSSRAWDEMRNSQNIDPQLIDERGLRFGRRRIMLWVSPSGFTDDQPTTLTVFHPFTEAEPLLRKAVWNHFLDIQPILAFENGSIGSLPEPKPTINVEDTTIDPAAFESQLAEGFQLRIPIVWPWSQVRDSLTTDVGLLGFEFFDIAEPQASVRCGWSMDLPPEWEPITEWFRRIYKWLDGHFGTM